MYVYSYEIGNRANYINNKEEKTYYFNDSAEKMKLEMIANPTKFMQVWGKILGKALFMKIELALIQKCSFQRIVILHYII